MVEEMIRFEEFLEAHLEQEMLRFTTAGSVDDGKSTLIGRLLHDTKSVYEDQLTAVKKSRVNRAANGHVDFSLLTDGLKAEREQGITIDVAYRYFSTARRKFIIADTPGHEQYTRNMATGASTADVAIVLIDAKAFLKQGGLLPQSKRHTYIASLLGIPHVVAAVNKMDLVEYSEETFAAIRGEFFDLAGRLGLASVSAIPVSALEGDNVVTPSDAMPWYEGPTLLEYLETVPLRVGEVNGPVRFPVQLVLRPDAEFRGFAGQVARGMVRAGQRVMALPSRRETFVRRIVTYDGDLPVAAYPQSVTVELEDEIDLSRGEMLVAAPEAGDTLPEVSRRFRAMVVWMHEEPLIAGRTYIAKHTTRTVRATVRAIRYRVDVGSLDEVAAERLAMNEIAEVEFETNLPLFFDAYAENRSMGALILIDGLTNATVGAAMILGAVEASGEDAERAVLVLVPGKVALAERVRDALGARGQRAVMIDDALIPDDAVVGVVRALQLAGVVAVSARVLSESVLVQVEGFANKGLVVGDGLGDEEILRLAGVTE
ncbi:bifunctional enzyme CysN/CysC/sulfate adenylyltransferase subunit 1 [Edaphobacter aggregans]|uniref:Sulfate adenylyltransferase subunit 1 n=1 Tax=Edaphobacter aggregans TaxID=570835 RepID=A0A3R9P8C4_9BACT|nr:sulfate adenylyltransferase subunit CysN [Edaphobacter aggregans]RSL15776.1 bifunctional enzyme CysN/CysC/sulfate adenylyltransferase subunit 1 [Edaphobacter aggregans]